MAQPKAQAAHSAPTKAKGPAWWLPAGSLGRLRLAFAVFAALQLFGFALLIATSPPAPGPFPLDIPRPLVVGLPVAMGLTMLFMQLLGPARYPLYLVDIAALLAVCIGAPQYAVNIGVAGGFGRAAYGTNIEALIRAAIYVAIPGYFVWAQPMVLPAPPPNLELPPGTPPPPPVPAPDPALMNQFIIQGVAAVVTAVLLNRLIAAAVERSQEAQRASNTLAAAAADLLSATDLARVQQVTEDCVRTLRPGAWVRLVLMGTRDVAPPDDAKKSYEIPLTSKGRRLGTLAVACDRKLPTVLLNTMNSLASQASAAIEAIELRDRLSHEATHDPLTGLPNRALFLDMVARALASAPAGGVVVLLVEVETAGNDALQVEIARRLVQCLRPGDAAARIDGGRFALVTAGRAETAETLNALAAQVRDLLGGPYTVDGMVVAVRCLVGTARGGTVTPDQISDAAVILLHRASAAVEAARHSDPVGAIGTAGPTRHTAGAGRNPGGRRAGVAAGGGAGELTADLSDALTAGRLSLSFTPVLALADGRPAIFCAVPAWPGRAQGTQLLATADRAGMLPRVTQWLVSATVRAAAQGQNETSVPVAIPVGAGHFAQPWLSDVVLGALREYGLPGSRLILEIVEDDLITHPEATAATLRQLRGAGMRVILSGFGAGVLGLRELSTVPVDMVIVDSAIVGSKPEEYAERIVRSIAGAAHAQNLPVIADGVTNRQQLAWLRDAGCDGARGPAFNRPPARPATPPQPARDSSGTYATG